jgi:hypothetical protein
MVNTSLRLFTHHGVHHLAVCLHETVGLRHPRKILKRVGRLVLKPDHLDLALVAITVEKIFALLLKPFILAL